MLKGCDAFIVAAFPAFPAFPAFAGRVGQIASQFNNGAAPFPSSNHPKNFHNNLTQGSAEQRTSWASAIMRYMQSEHCDNLTEFFPDQEFKSLFYYDHGYLIPRVGVEKQCVDWLRENINKMSLNVERVHIDGCGNQAIQVLNSALAGGVYSLYDRTDEGELLFLEMCKIVLTAQYEAVAAVAILEARANPKKRIPVTFTLVGGGTFGNPPEAIAAALKAAFTLLNESGSANLDVCLSVFEAEELKIYQKNPDLSIFFENATEMDQDTLQKTKHLAPLQSVGGGTFGNPPEAIAAEAFTLLNEPSSANPDVFLSVFKAEELEINQEKSELSTFNENDPAIDQDTLQETKHLDPLQNAINNCKDLCDIYIKHLQSNSHNDPLRTKKLDIVQSARAKLNGDITSEEEITVFFSILAEGSPTLKKRRVSALMTFLKGLAVVFAILPPILGNYLAWKKLFSPDEATHGGRFFKKIAKVNKDNIEKVTVTTSPRQHESPRDPSLKKE